MAYSGKFSDQAGEFEKIIVAYYEDIYKFCFRRIRDPAEAQDITQDTFIRFMDAADAYVDIEKPKALLYTIARNLCLNWVKKVRPVPLDELESSSAPVTEDFAEESIRKIYLSVAVSALPDNQQDILILRYGQGLKVGEIAEILGLSRFQAMYQIRSALDRRRKSMREED